MAEARYQVPGIPEGPAAGLSAFMPQLTPHAASGAQAYKYDVVSYLGLVQVPAPTGDTQISPDIGDAGMMGSGRSSDAPQAWWPQKGYQATALERPGAGMPVQVYSPTQPGLTTLLPVPAQDYRAQYGRDSARLARPAILQRIRQLPWFPKLYQAPDGTYNG